MVDDASAAVLLRSSSSAAAAAATTARNVDWVKNIAAVGGFELETKGTVVLLVDPVVEHDSSAAWAPVGVRQVLRVASATDYLQARQA